MKVKKINKLMKTEIEVRSNEEKAMAILYKLNSNNGMAKLFE